MPDDNTEFEADLWCPSCKVYYGKVFRKRVSEAVWEHVTRGSAAKYCTLCNAVVERVR